jgi:hypothetical protein
VSVEPLERGAKRGGEHGRPLSDGRAIFAPRKD